MTCEKHCLHWEVCKLTPPEYATAKYYTFCNCAEKCECFKDKSKYIELPCNIGNKVYIIDPFNGICDMTLRNVHVNDVLKNNIFLTKSEAEQKLKELKENANS